MSIYAKIGLGFCAISAITSVLSLVAAVDKSDESDDSSDYCRDTDNIVENGSKFSFLLTRPGFYTVMLVIDVIVAFLLIITG